MVVGVPIFFEFSMSVSDLEQAGTFLPLVDPNKHDGVDWPVCCKIVYREKKFDSTLEIQRDNVYLKHYRD
ncbi:MAG: hypothetical protein HQL74_04880 [Magnetococcales bacterium]|nr:hypothetical protein [Magnetococcales bacterium]